MSARLNAGCGTCTAEATIQFRPPKVVFELGAAPDVFRAVLTSVHHLNRNGSVDDYLAVAFPEIRKKYSGRLVPGGVVEVLGTERRLAELLASGAIETLKRREMIHRPVIDEPILDIGEQGAAYVRDRSGEKWTPGWIRRAQKRAQKRNVAWPDKVKIKSHPSSLLALPYNGRYIAVREVVGAFQSKTIEVSTYGFSSPSGRNLGVLPVFPESTREDADAA